MKAFISSRSKLALQILGAYQIIGGAVGLFMVIYAFFTQLPVFGIPIIFPFIFLLLFSYSIFCGNKCLQLSENALTYSLYNQLFQLLGFCILGFAFKYVSGIAFNIKLDFTNGFDFTLKGNFPGFGIDYKRDPQIMKIDLNIVAIILTFFIDSLMKRVSRERKAYYSFNK